MFVNKYLCYITYSVKKQAIGAREVHMTHQLFNLCQCYTRIKLEEE